MMNRAEMNEEMMEQVVGGIRLKGAVNPFNPMCPEGLKYGTVSDGNSQSN